MLMLSITTHSHFRVWWQGTDVSIPIEQMENTKAQREEMMTQVMHSKSTTKQVERLLGFGVAVVALWGYLWGK